MMPVFNLYIKMVVNPTFECAFRQRVNMSNNGLRLHKLCVLPIPHTLGQLDSRSHNVHNHPQQELREESSEGWWQCQLWLQYTRKKRVLLGDEKEKRLTTN